MRPDRVRTDFKVEAMGRVTVTVQLIIVDGQWWTTDLITGKWGPAPTDFEYDPSVLFDNQGGIGPVMDRVTDAQRLDDEEIDGHKAFHVQALVSDQIINSLTYHTLQGTPITVDLWIDQGTFDLLRARLAEHDDRRIHCRLAARQDHHVFGRHLDARGRQRPAHHCLPRRKQARRPEYRCKQKCNHSHPNPQNDLAHNNNIWLIKGLRIHELPSDHRAMRVERMIEDKVLSTPDNSPIRSISRSSSEMDGAATMAIRS